MRSIQDNNLPEANHRANNSNDYTDYARAEKETVFNEFGTSADGLSTKDAEERIKKHGHNEPAKKKKISAIKQILLKFINPLIIVLIVIMVFSLFFGEKISALFVGMMIVMSVFIDFGLEYKSEKAVEKLHELVKTRVTVIRNGQREEIDLKKVVPGDIIDLYAGDMIPADIRIISCKDLFINQSSLTGEAFPVEKTAEPVKPKSNSISELGNIAFMGSSVVSGTGVGIVIRTGVSTQFGEISKSLAAVRVQTSFEKGIKKFTMLMIKFMLVLVIAIFLIISFYKHGPLKDALLFSLAVAVGLTPEMLPMIVSINLANGAIKMAKKKVIVKRLNSIQNFGAMDILCTDKTGTLTMDKIVLEKHCDVTGKESEEVLKYAYINSFFQTGLKNLLDRAILNYEHIAVTHIKRIDEIPFDFMRKIMSVVVEIHGKHEIIAKGAPEEIFKRCTHYELNGKVKNATPKIFAELKKRYYKLSAEGFRVLAIAYKETKSKKKDYSKDDENSLVLKGYVAFLDPVKPSAKEVIKALEELGVQIKILTGDNEIITRKICSDAGLKISGIATGDNIDNLSNKELGELAEKVNVFARLNPQQKERIIKALQENKHTVGYLGDGINDAPSLKTADVGISVNNAVDIAKESADIILLEKSLMVLQDGVVGGRRIFGNIIKYIKMGASSNFGNMLSMTGATLFLPFLPMLPIQILLNNFLYDISQIPLPTDKVDEEYIKKPRPWNIDFIEKFMLFIGPVSSIFDFLTFGILLFIFHASPELFHTGWFFESLCTQTLIIYVIRTNKIPFVESRPSKWLMATTILILIIALGIIFSSVGSYLGFVALPGLYFAILLGMLAAYFVMVQFVKTWVVNRYGYQ